MTLGAAVLMMAQAAPAEVVKSERFQGDVQRRAIKPLADGTPMSHIYVSVTTVAGAVPGRAMLPQAGAFAAQAGCRAGTPLSTVVAGVDAQAAEFEVLCRGDR
ncbi:hypothetical protein AVJ23_19345 [Pseudoponticoccus marisrubri]|uniref:Uncharacterized protein n=2 Tax=Pseudoponticoccus marisrubri TaxID=1685382 RepID=A0A0W7WEL0_9RHOB|nr:hypothetical protein AVJ23_19345 [Pseudoponticoccus marisrubri]